MTTPALSVAIPARDEEKLIARCIESINASARHCQRAVEVVVALNRCTDRTRDIAESLGARCVVEDRKCIAAVRNAAVKASRAPVVATLDADSWMTLRTVDAILTHACDPRYVGGGTVLRPERMSIGIFFSLLAIVPYVARSGVSTGLFWFRREAFDMIGGFDESLVSVEDVDFGLRLKAHGRLKGLRYGTIWRHGAMTSCRKFDTFGDWYLFLNPGLVKALFGGKNRQAADHFYYEVER